MKPIELSVARNLPIKNLLQLQQEKLYQQIKVLIDDPKTEAELDTLGLMVATCFQTLNKIKRSDDTETFETQYKAIYELLSRCRPFINMLSEENYEKLLTGGTIDKNEIAIFKQIEDQIRELTTQFKLDDIRNQLTEIQQAYQAALENIIQIPVNQRENILKPKAQLILPMGIYRISQCVAQELLCLDPYGYKKKTGYGGTHSVVRLHNVFYKPNNAEFNPIKAVTEQSAGYLMQLCNPELSDPLLSSSEDLMAAPSDLIKIREVMIHPPFEMYELENDSDHKEAYIELQSYLQSGKTAEEFIADHPDRKLKLKTQFIENTIQAGLGVDGVLLQDLLSIYFVFKQLHEIIGLKKLRRLLRNFNVDTTTKSADPAEKEALLNQYRTLMEEIEPENRINEFQVDVVTRQKDALNLQIHKYGFESVKWLFELLNKHRELCAGKHWCDYLVWFHSFKDLIKLLPDMTQKKRITWALTLLNYFDEANFSRQVIAALKSNPTDGKGDNYIVKIIRDEDGNIIKLLICGIDNDQAFGMPIDIADNGKQAPLHFAGIKCILFLLDELMNKPISQTVKQQFLKISPEGFLFNWLNAMAVREMKYQEWIDKNYLVESDMMLVGNQVLDIPFTLPSYFVELMMRRIRQIHSLVTQNEEITHRSLFNTIYPVLADYYEEVGKKTNYDPQSGMSAIYREADFTVENILKNHETHQASLGSYLDGVDKADALNKKAPDFTLCKMVQYLVSQIRFRDFNTDEMGFLQQINVIGYYTTLQFNNMTVKKCHQLIERAIADGLSGAVRILLDQNIINDNFPGEIIHKFVEHYNDPRISVAQVAHLAELIMKDPRVNLNLKNSEGYLPLFLMLHGIKEDTQKAELLLKIALGQGLMTSFLQTNSSGETESIMLRAFGICHRRENFKLMDFLIEQGLRSGYDVLKLYGQFSLLRNNRREYPHVVSVYSKLLQRDPAFAWIHTLSTLSHVEPTQYPDLVNAYKPLTYRLPGMSDERIVPFKPSVEKAILEAKDGILSFQKNQDTFGRHYVLPIENLYFKFFPESYGMEGAANNLAKCLFEREMLSTQFMRINFADHDLSVPVLASQKIEGQNLQNLFSTLKEDELKEILDKLDPIAFSELALLMLLLDPEDGKPDNFVLELFVDENGIQRYRLKSVDNDHIFVSPFKYVKDARGGGSQILQIKTIVFCLENMKRSLHPDVVNRFIRLPVYDVLQSWIFSIHKYDEEAKELFTDVERKYLSKIDEAKGNPVIFGMPLPAQTISKLYDKMQRLQTILKQKPAIIALDLLEKIHPSVGQCYREAFNQSPSPRGRFFFVVKDLYLLHEDNNEYCTKTTLLQLMDTQQINLGNSKSVQTEITLQQRLNELKAISTEHLQLIAAKESLKKGSFVEFDKLLLPESKQKILNQIDYRQFPPDSIKKKLRKPLLQYLRFHLGQIHFTKLILQHVNFLKPKSLETILSGSPDLKKLVLDDIGDKDFTKSLSNLSDYCPNLQSLTLSQVMITELKSFSKRSMSGRLHMPHLEVLTIKNCSKLIAIKIGTTSLINLTVLQSPVVEIKDILNLLLDNTGLSYFYFDNIKLNSQLPRYCALYSQWHKDQKAALFAEGVMINNGVLRLEGLPIKPMDIPTIFKDLPLRVVTVNLADVAEQFLCFAETLKNDNINNVVLQNPLSARDAEQAQRAPMQLINKGEISSKRNAHTAVIARINDDRFVRIPSLENQLYFYYQHALDKPIVPTTLLFGAPKLAEKLNNNILVVVDKKGLYFVDLQTYQLLLYKKIADISCLTVLSSEMVAVSVLNTIFIISFNSRRLYESRFINKTNNPDHVPSSNILEQAKASMVTKLKFVSPNILLIGSMHGYVNSYNLVEKEFEMESRLHAPNLDRVKDAGISDIACFPDGQFATSSPMSKFIYIWNIYNKNAVQLGDEKSEIGHKLSITCLLQINRQFLLSGSMDHTLKLWDIGTRALLGTYMQHHSPLTSIIRLNDETIISSDAADILDALQLGVGFGYSQSAMNVWEIKDFTKPRNTENDINLDFRRAWNHLFTFVASKKTILIQWPSTWGKPELEANQKDLKWIMSLFPAVFNQNDIQFDLYSGVQQLKITANPQYISLFTSLLTALKPSQQVAPFSIFPSYQAVNIPEDDWFYMLSAVLPHVNSDKSDSSSEEELLYHNEGIFPEIDLKSLKRCESSLVIELRGNIVLFHPNNKKDKAEESKSNEDKAINRAEKTIDLLRKILEPLNLRFVKHVFSDQWSLDMFNLVDKVPFLTFLETLLVCKINTAFYQNQRNQFWNYIKPSAPEESSIEERKGYFVTPFAPEMSISERMPLPSAPSFSEKLPLPSAPSFSESLDLL